MPPPDLGQLRHRVTIQTPVDDGTMEDQYGQAEPEWADGSTIWARVRTPTGREAVNADQLKVELTHVVTTRYRASIDPTMQLVHGGKTLRITHIIPDETKTLMDCYCVERVNESED
jgi:SPP1 family predicted phage head-tail adaptor